MDDHVRQGSEAAEEGVATRRVFLGMAAGAVSGAAVPVAPRAAGDERGVLEVAIIGAGLAGLTAARDLLRAGCKSFAVLEARDRVGGRTLNHDLGNGYFSEAGGQWIGPGQTAVADLARELGVGTFPSYWQGKTTMIAGDARATVSLDGGFASDPTLTAELEEMARSVPCAAPWTSPRAAEFDAVSLGDWLSQKKVAPEDQIGWTIGVALSGGIAPSRVSLLHWLSMINSAGCSYHRLQAIKDGAQGTRISGGAQALSTRMAQELGDKVRLSTPVTRIDNWRDGPVAIHTPDGVVRARRVIVALSPPLCKQIAFDPPLPEQRSEMQRRWPAHGAVRKTALVYKKAFWRDQGLNGWIFQPKGPVLWAYDNSPEDVSFGVINAFVSNGMLASDSKTAALELARIYAQAFGDEALHPLAFYQHDWAKDDPWTLTCVSPMPPGFLTRYGPALHPPAGRLIWSGSETAEIWSGYMDGAVRSGHKAALQALAARSAR